jgi:hypothetical protein
MIQSPATNQFDILIYSYIRACIICYKHLFRLATHVNRPIVLEVCYVLKIYLLSQLFSALETWHSTLGLKIVLGLYIIL